MSVTDYGTGLMAHRNENEVTRYEIEELRSRIDRIECQDHMKANKSKGFGRPLDGKVVTSGEPVQWTAKAKNLPRVLRELSLYSRHIEDAQLRTLGPFQPDPWIIYGDSGIVGAFSCMSVGLSTYPIPTGDGTNVDTLVNFTATQIGTCNQSSNASLSITFYEADGSIFYTGVFLCPYPCNFVSQITFPIAGAPDLIPYPPNPNGYLNPIIVFNGPEAFNQIMAASINVSTWNYEGC